MTNTSRVTGVFEGGSLDGLTAELPEVVDRTNDKSTGEIYRLVRDDQDQPAQDTEGRYRYALVGS